MIVTAILKIMKHNFQFYLSFRKIILNLELNFAFEIPYQKKNLENYVAYFEIVEFKPCRIVKNPWRIVKSCNLLKLLLM